MAMPNDALYFAAFNPYHHVDGHWTILAFESRAARDIYSALHPDQRPRAILRDSIPAYLGRSMNIFAGERYVLGRPTLDDAPGLVAEVYIGTLADPRTLRPLNAPRPPRKRS